MTVELTPLSSVSHRRREITSPRLRGLHALPAGELRAGCGAGRLVDGLWPDEPATASPPHRSPFGPRSASPVSSPLSTT